MYVIFHNSTLTAIAVARPSSLAELLRVPGVGDSKLRNYGEEGAGDPVRRVGRQERVRKNSPVIKPASNNQ